MSSLKTAHNPTTAPLELRRAVRSRSKQPVSFDDVPFAPPRVNDGRGIDITLIYPSVSKKEMTGGKDISDDYGNMPPLGIAYLASALAAKGYDVDAVDPKAMKLSDEELLSRLAESNPGVIGISALSPTFQKSLGLARDIRERFPEAIIVCGGPHPTLHAQGLLEDYPVFDILCLGEGEVTIVDLMNTLRPLGYSRRALTDSGDLLAGVPGIGFRANGEVCFTGNRSFVDVNTLPLPARHLLPVESYIPWPTNYRRLPIVHLFVSRGCPWNCTFCGTPYIWGNKVRFRTPENVIAEIRHAVETFGAREINFQDDTFSAKPEWLEELCERLVEARLGVIWRCMARTSDMTAELARIMARAGCWQISYGFESANQDCLDAIRKGTTVEAARQAVRVTQEAGMQVRGMFMLGLPNETPEKAQRTIDFAIECDLDFAQFTVTAPHKGTDLYAMADHFGLLIEEDFSRYMQHNAVFIPDGYRDAAEIYAMVKKAHRSFYFRPRYLWKVAKSIRSLSDLNRYYQGMKIALAMISFK